MNANRTLKHLFFISSAFGLASLTSLLIAPKGASSVLIHSLLLPLGILCPIISGGCLLHDRFELRKPWAALMVKLGGLGLFWSSVLFFIRKHWG